MDEGKNIFGMSKKIISEKLYHKLVDEFDFEPYAIGFEDFSQCFIDVLEDYMLVPKTDVIE